MAITVNKNTSQQPNATAGLTGTQVIRFVDASRVYIKAAESITAAPIPIVKSNGTTPSGWTDLGSVNGKVKITYDKKVQEVRTGIDKKLRALYCNEYNGQFEFMLDQFDDLAFQKVSGLSASVVTSGSVITFLAGSEDLNQQALLLVAQNKLDGKEWQFYNPNAFINFAVDNTGDQMCMKATGILPFFTANGAAAESMLGLTMFA